MHLFKWSNNRETEMWKGSPWKAGAKGSGGQPRSGTRLGRGGSAPKADAPNNKRFVYIEAFVRQNGGVASGGSKGESCNCKTKVKKLLDTHIEVVADLNAPGISTGNGKFIVETTERSRRLAKAGLLFCGSTQKDLGREHTVFGREQSFVAERYRRTFPAPLRLAPASQAAGPHPGRVPPRGQARVLPTPRPRSA